MPLSHLERARLIVVSATIAINILAVALLTLVPSSDWRTGLALNLFDNLLLLIFVLVRRDVLLAKLMVFGLIVGLVELAADAWLVDYTRTLDYSVGGGPVLWRSPIWMPLAWEVVTVQFGCLGIFFMNRFGWLGLGINGLLGAVNIPYYEEMARRIHWWQYSRCRMISGTPYYIILGEFAIAVAVGWLAVRVANGNKSTPWWAGIAGGATIFIAYAFAYLITDGFPKQ
jgi:hypothetical protein